MFLGCQSRRATLHHRACRVFTAASEGQPPRPCHMPQRHSIGGGLGVPGPYQALCLSPKLILTNIEAEYWPLEDQLPFKNNGGELYFHVPYMDPR